MVYLATLAKPPQFTIFVKFPVPSSSASSSAPSTQPCQTAPAPSAHYENFPVASFLCPAKLRPPIAAIYWFARVADDLADEGIATAEQRLHDLTAYRIDLKRTAASALLKTAEHPSDTALSVRWPHVFTPLSHALRHFSLPLALLEDLLSAFEQDVHKNAAGDSYANDAELHDYCRRSANPVGRLLLHLYGVNDAASLALSDNICTALQLINFWQDLSLDIPRGRYYLPQADCLAHAVTLADVQALQTSPQLQALIASKVSQARTLMLAGSALVRHIPGRAGWELRLVVQGGLRILDKIQYLEFMTLNQRPKLTAWDAPLIFWRSLRMK